MTLPRPEGHAVRLRFVRSEDTVTYEGMERTPSLLAPRPSQEATDHLPDPNLVSGSWYVIRDASDLPIYITDAHDPAHVRWDIPPAPPGTPEGSRPDDDTLRRLINPGPVSFELYIPNDERARKIEIYSTDFRDVYPGHDDALVGRFELTWEPH